MENVIFIYLAIIAGVISFLNVVKAYALSKGFTELNKDVFHCINYSGLYALVCGINLGMYYV